MLIYKVYEKKEKWSTDYTEGVAPPTYYCRRNPQMTEEKSWNENKVLKYSNTYFHGFLLIIRVHSCNSWAKKEKNIERQNRFNSR
jgi:hypothetical protein